MQCKIYYEHVQIYCNITLFSVLCIDNSYFKHTTYKVVFQYKALTTSVTLHMVIVQGHRVLAYHAYHRQNNIHAYIHTAVWEIPACEQRPNHLTFQELRVTSVAWDMICRKCRLFRTTYTADLTFLLSIKSERRALCNFTNVPLKYYSKVPSISHLVIWKF